MDFEIKDIMTANNIVLVNDKGKTEKINIQRLDKTARAVLKSLVFTFFNDKNGVLDNEEQKIVYKSLKPYLADKKLTNKEIAGFRKKFFIDKNNVKLKNEIKKLINKLENKNPNAIINYAIVEKLVKIGYPAETYLMEVMDNNGEKLTKRLNAALVLAKLGNTAAFLFIKKVFINKKMKFKLRLAIAGELTSLSARGRVMNIYIEVLKNKKENEHLRSEVICKIEAMSSQLGAKEAQAAVPYLIKIIDKKSKESLHMRLMAIDVLGSMAHTRKDAQKALKEIYNDKTQPKELREKARKASKGISDIEGI